MCLFRKALSVILSVLLLSSTTLSFAQTQRLRTNVDTSWNEQEGRGISFRSQAGADQMGRGRQLPFQAPEVGMLPSTEGMASMMLGNQYQINVVGEVRNPGTYSVNASTRLSQALDRAGGISLTGSQRHITIKRGSSVIGVDYLKYMLFGSLQDNPYLMDNDVVYVPLRRDVVQVVGAVKRPAIYELNGEKNVADIIKLAGGFAAGALYEKPIKIIRFDKDKKNVIDVSNNPDDLSKFAINGGDVIYVPNVVTAQNEFDYNVITLPGEQEFYPSYEDRVFVLGGVNYPGAYPFSPQYKINQYISLSGGINDRGSPRYKIISIDGKVRSAKADSIVNPGDTIIVKQHWMSPAAWISFAMGIASFGMSVAATTIALTR